MLNADRAHKQLAPQHFILLAIVRQRHERFLGPLFAFDNGLHTTVTLVVMYSPCQHLIKALVCHWFFTNIFPGNCWINRFISRPSSATDTAELGRPLLKTTHYAAGLLNCLDI